MFAKQGSDTPLSDSMYPGICDFHVHIGELIGGYVLRDDFQALDRIAHKHGIDAVGVFVTEEPGVSIKNKLRSMQQEAAQHFHGHVHWHLSPLTETIEEIYPLLEEGCDLKFYTTYKNAGLYTSYKRIGQWMDDLRQLHPRILVHCEDDAIIESQSFRYPFNRPFDHSLRRPESAEQLAVEKVLDLAVKKNYPVHIVHVSSPDTALMIREAKQHVPNITCETAPHYLLYNNQLLEIENSHRWICTPPFRSERSRGMLVELLQDGCFDIIASDHCAFKPEDKDRYRHQPERVPCGIPGLETLFPSLYNNLVATNKTTFEYLLDLCSYNPTRMMGITCKAQHTLDDLLGGCTK